MPSPPVAPGRPDYLYWSQLRYRGSTGVDIVLEYDLCRPPTKHARWWWRFANSRTWRGGTTDKLGADPRGADMRLHGRGDELGGSVLIKAIKNAVRVGDLG